MFKRLFFALLGLGAGVVLGVAVVRRAEQARQRLSPAGIAGAASERASSFRERLDVALAAGREAALEKEAELRSLYKVRPASELAETAPVPPRRTGLGSTDSRQG